MARPKDPELEPLWKQRLRRHSTSGLSVSEFCAREGIASFAFSYRKRRLAAAPCAARQRPPLFVPLHVKVSDVTEARRASASRSCCLIRSGSASILCPSSNGSAASWPRSRACRAGWRHDDHALLDRPHLPLHPAHRHAQELRRPLGAGPGGLRPGPPRRPPLPLRQSPLRSHQAAPLQPRRAGHLVLSGSRPARSSCPAPPSPMASSRSRRNWP